MAQAPGKHSRQVIHGEAKKNISPGGKIGIYCHAKGRPEEIPARGEGRSYRHQENHSTQIPPRAQGRDDNDQGDHGEPVLTVMLPEED